MFPGKRLADRKPLGLAKPVEHYHGAPAQRCGTPGGLNRAFQSLRSLREAQVPGELLARDSAVGIAAQKPRQGTPRADDRVEQTAGGAPLAKFETVCEQAFDTKIPRQRTHHVVEALADQHDGLAHRERFLQLFHASALELRPQDIVEILFAEKVKAVAADAAEQRVQKPRRKNAVRSVSHRAQKPHQAHASAPGPALGKTLRVPGEIPDRAKSAQLEQTAFHAPEDGCTQCASGRRRAN